MAAIGMRSALHVPVIAARRKSVDILEDRLNSGEKKPASIDAVSIPVYVRIHGQLDFDVASLLQAAVDAWVDAMHTEDRPLLRDAGTFPHHGRSPHCADEHSQSLRPCRHDLEANAMDVESL